MHAAPAAVPPSAAGTTAASRPARTIRPPAKLVETPTLPVAKARGRKPGSKNKGGRAPGTIAIAVVKAPGPTKAKAGAAIGKQAKSTTAAKKAKAAAALALTPSLLASSFGAGASPATPALPRRGPAAASKFLPKAPAISVDEVTAMVFADFGHDEEDEALMLMSAEELVVVGEIREVDVGVHERQSGHGGCFLLRWLGTS